MKRNDLKNIGSANNKSFDRSSQTSFVIQDERGEFMLTYTGYFHPLETRTLSELHSRIYLVVGIQEEERDSVQIVFMVNNEVINIRYPSELIGSDGIVAIITSNSRSNVLSDSIETDKFRYMEEHANALPHSNLHNLVLSY